MKRTIPITIVLVIIISLIAVWFWYTSPSRQIEKTLETMAELGSAPTGESSIAKALKSQSLSKYFSEAAFIDWPGDEVIPAGRWAGREQITQQVLAAKSSASYQVSISDLLIEAPRRTIVGAAEFTLVVREGVNTWAWLAQVQLSKNGQQWLVNQLVFEPILKR